MTSETEWRRYAVLLATPRARMCLILFTVLSPDVIFRIQNEPVTGVNVSPAPAPRDVDEALREHPEVVGDTLMQ